MKRRKLLIAFTMSLLISITSLVGVNLSVVAADQPQDETVNLAFAKHMLSYANSDLTYEFTDVTDYKGVAGDTGVLVTITPNAVGATSAYRAFVYADTLLSTKEISAEFKVLGPDPMFQSDTTAVDWFAAGILPSTEKTFMDLDAQALVISSQWGLSARMPYDGTLANKSPESEGWAVNCGGYGFANDLLGNDYLFKVSANTDDNEFEFVYNKFFDYATYEAWGALSLFPDAYGGDYKLSITPDEYEKGYFSLGLTLIVQADTEPEPFEVLIKSITGEKLITAIEQISFPNDAESVKVGESIQLAPVVLPADADGDIVFSTKNDMIARVSADGTVTGVNKGNTTITVACALDESIKATVLINVTEDIAEGIIDAAKAENMFGYGNTDAFSYAFKDVTDHNGVLGDSGVLVTITPKNVGAHGAYVYSKVPLSTNDVFVNYKILTPSPLFSSSTTMLDWFAPALMPTLNQTYFENHSNPGLIFTSWWSKGCRIPYDGTMLGKNPAEAGGWAVSTGAGFATDPLNNDYIMRVTKAENKNEFEFEYDKFFRADIYEAWGAAEAIPNPYGGETALTITPESMPYAYFTFGGLVIVREGTTPEPVQILIKSIQTSVIEAEEINIQGDAQRTLTAGDTIDLQAVFTPQYVTVNDTQWASSDETVCTVDAMGKVTAIGKGTCTITVTTINGKEDSITINVTSAVTGITFEDTKLTVEKGKTVKLAPIVAPSDANKDVIYNTSDSSIATVASDGTVTGIKAGSVTITVTSVQNPSIIAEITITVTSSGCSGCGAGIGIYSSMIMAVIIAAAVVVFALKRKNAKN